MKYFALIIPILIFFLFIYASVKKVKIYDSFVCGASNGLRTVFSVLPYLITVFIMTELFYQSGLSKFLINKFSPVLEFFKIPKELAPLVILKPFSGSGSLAVLSDIFSVYGADSYISRCACTVFGSSETIFYLSAVYFSSSKEKRLLRPIVISLVATFISTVFSCFICRFI